MSQRLKGKSDQDVWSWELNGQGSELLLTTLNTAEIVLSKSCIGNVSKQVNTYQEQKEESSRCLIHTVDQNLEVNQRLHPFPSKTQNTKMANVIGLQ